MKDVMIDFETLGNGAHKCVCQVGAVYFNNSTGELGETIDLTIDAASHEKYGGRLDANTVYWWLQQSEAARQSICVKDKLDIKEAFLKLNAFLSNASRIWSHATFDFVTLVETMKQLDIKPSFTYKAGLDLRTLVYLSGTTMHKSEREGVHHNGLADAIFQVKYAVKAMNTIKTSKSAIKFLEGLKSE